MKSTCIRCKYFKIEDSLSGFCRVQIRKSRDKQAPKPMVKQDDTCENWEDCGQQYYIRLGWIKSQETAKDKETPH